MLKAHRHPDRRHINDWLGDSSGSSASSEDVSRDVIGHLDVGQLIGSYFGDVEIPYDDPTFPVDGQDCEFIISTGDRCRAVMDHPNIKGWWRHYLLDRSESYVRATPYLATVPIIYGPNTWPTLGDSIPLAYSGESIVAVNMTVDMYCGNGLLNCSGSCTRTPTTASLKVYRIDEDGNRTDSTTVFSGGETKTLSPAANDLSVVSHVVASASDDNDPAFVLFIMQSETAVHADIPLRAP